MKKQYYPKISFSINKNFEKEFFKHFKKPERAMPRSLEFLFRKDFKNIRQKILEAYVDNYYKIYGEEMKRDMKISEHGWEKMQKYFYQQTDRIFKNYNWPKGNYRAHPSIWYLFPREISTKKFAFPGVLEHYTRRNFPLQIIAHEMLHFITYDYLQKKYGLNPSEWNSENNTFWQFTENLNVLIENEKNWHRFTGGDISKPYSDCAKLHQKMKRIWDKNKNLDNLIEKILINNK